MIYTGVCVYIYIYIYIHMHTYILGGRLPKQLVELVVRCPVLGETLLPAPKVIGEK